MMAKDVLKCISLKQHKIVVLPELNWIIRWEKRQKESERVAVMILTCVCRYFVASRATVNWRRGDTRTVYGHWNGNVRLTHWLCLSYQYQLRSQGLVHCVTSQVAGALRCPFLHHIHLFHFSQASFGKRKTVGRGVVVHHSACHPAHWQQRRMKCEELMSLGQLHGVREWKGELETLGCEIAVERRKPLLLPAGNSC